MIEIWQDYWWAVTLAALFAMHTLVFWTTISSRGRNQARFLKELSSAYDIVDQEKANEARFRLIRKQQITNKKYDRLEFKTIISTIIPLLLSIIIFLLAGILAKISG